MKKDKLKKREEREKISSLFRLALGTHMGKMIYSA
jgi:hypothetical protein